METLELLEQIENTTHIIEQINSGVTGDVVVDNGYQRMFDDDFNKMQENKVCLFDSLKPKARLMLEIGIVQAILINEFKFEESFSISRLTKHSKNMVIYVDFLSNFVGFTVRDDNTPNNNMVKKLFYKDNNWRENLLTIIGNHL